MSLFLIIAILLALTAVFGVINERFLHMQPTIGLLLLALLTTFGVVLLKASGVLEATPFYDEVISRLDLSDVLLNGVLCFMLFSGSAGVKMPILRENRWVIFSLAFGSTLIAWVIIGYGLSAVLGLFGISLALAYAFVFGALISPTDPIAALAILKSAGLPKRLETIINGESLFNDGVGVVLFTVALAFASGAERTGVTSAMELFLREGLGGLVVGLAVGWVTHRALLGTREFANQLLVTLATVALGYAIALQIKVSGPIAMVVAGLMVGNVTLKRLPKESTRPVLVFWSGIDELLNSLLFVLIGFVAILVHRIPAAPLGISVLCAIVVCLLARAVSVYLPLKLLSGGSLRGAHVLNITKLLTWGGLRGGLALALVMSLPPSAEKPLLVNLTFGVVVFSILVQGSTIGRMFSRSDLKSMIKSPARD